MFNRRGGRGRHQSCVAALAGTRTIGSREISFLNRPIVYADEPDVRKFYTFDRSGKLLAFAFFDPIYEDGQIIGYLTAIRRRLPESDPLINYWITLRAIETFRREGRKWLFWDFHRSPVSRIKS